MEVEIYHHQKRLESINRRINENLSILENNKKLIERFRDDCFAHNISKARIVRHLYCLRDMAVWIAKDFEICKSDDLKQLVAKIEQMTKYSPRTKYEYRATLKKFYKWLKNNKEPEEVNWIDLKLKKHNDKLPSELLTEDEIILMINATKSSRDRAMIISLYESGCRIGEFLKIRLKEIIFERPGCIFFVSGKTGGRRIRLISAEPYLIEWLNRHPAKNNPEAFLWIENHSMDMLQYPAFCKALRVAARRANIHKKVNPHNFRHSRATYLAARFTEQQLKVFFGWTRASEMAAVYVHLSGKDVDDALLTAYGMKEAPKIITELKPVACMRCNTENEATNRFCRLCGTILDANTRDTIISNQSDRSEVDKLMNNLIKDKEFLTVFMRKVQELRQ